MTNNILELDKANCCGCGACVNICPKKAIKLKENSEGFLYPKIDETKCINCGLCKKCCPVINSDTIVENNFPKAFAAKNLNKIDQKNSSSGGIFISIAKKIIELNGVVYGAAYNNKFEVNNVRVCDEFELITLQGSKYVQSNMNNVFVKVKEDLDSNRYVLFSGTPCQVKSLKNFLRKDYEKLLTCDLVCHGVPSQKIFKKYICYLEKKYHKKIKKYDFRNKEKKGWGLTSKIIFEDDTCKYINSDFDPYYDNFLNATIYRESCYNCKFCNLKRCSDITLADYWGVLSFHPDFYDKDGVSLILVNTEKGENILKQLKTVEILKTDVEKAMLKNQNLKKPSNRPYIRDKIYDDIENDCYIKNNLKYKINLKKIIKPFIPTWLKKMIKKYVR